MSEKSLNFGHKKTCQKQVFKYLVGAQGLEPKGLTVNRFYEILWKKQRLDIAELARMQFEEKLGSRVISQRLGLPRTTVSTVIRRLENKNGLKSSMNRIKIRIQLFISGFYDFTLAI